MKKFLSLSLFLAMTSTAWGTPLTPQQALQRLQQDGARKLPAKVAATAKLAYTQKALNAESPALYVFNKESGYIILSADDVAVPVLGYSDSGSFDPMQIPPQMQYWLDEYARQIATAVAMPNQPTPTDGLYSPPIEPLVKAKWDQAHPYNYACPASGTTKSMTGCVATAVAQVMHFWKYPAVGTGTSAAMTSGVGKNLTMDFASQAFDWNNMLDRYNGSYSETQRDAVAYLMKACGYAVNMNYGTAESGAQSHNIGKALINNFKYNKNISFERRDYYTTPEWEKMIYLELMAGRPVIYAGQALHSAHQFVCDGYQKGLFHFNWGWSGSSDGYFALQALNPAAVGIGGGTGGGYNYGQSIIKNVQPEYTGTYDAPLSRIAIQGDITGKVANNLVYIYPHSDTSTGMFYSVNYNTTSGSLGVVIKDAATDAEVGAQPIALWSFSGLGIMSGYYAQNTTTKEPESKMGFTFPSSLPNGTYKCVLSFKPSSATTYSPVLTQIGKPNYIIVNKNGSTITVQPAAVTKCEILNATSTNLYTGGFGKITIDIKNPSSDYMSQTVGIRLINSAGDAVYESEGYTFTLQPNETAQKEWVVNFNVLSGQKAITSTTKFTLQFVEYQRNTIFDYNTLKADMKVATPTLTLSDQSMPGLPTSTLSCGTWGTQTVYTAPNLKEIPIMACAKSGIEFCAGTIIGTLTRLSNSGTAGNFSFPTVSVMPKGAEYILTYFDMPEIPAQDEIYKIEMRAIENGRYSSVKGSPLYFRIDPEYMASVDEIATNSEIALTFDKETATLKASARVANIEIYDLAGRKLSEATDTDHIVIEATRGVVIAKIRTIGGTLKTEKIIL